jgi:hypothetical protein
MTWHLIAFLQELWRVCDYCVEHWRTVCVSLRFSAMCPMGMETAQLTRTSTVSVERFRKNFWTAVPKQPPIVICVHIEWFLDLVCIRIDDWRGVNCGSCSYKWELFISQTRCALEYEDRLGVFREKVEKVCAVTSKRFPLLFQYITFRIICSYIWVQGR